MKGNKGITLVALVITIIVLIILAAVSINLVLGENGVMKKAQEGAIKSEIARENEAVQMTLAELRLSNKGSLSFDETTLEEAVERNANEDVTVTKGDDDKFVVKFTKSGREYEVTPDGEKTAGDKQTLVSQITSANYGDKVNYSVTVNGVTLDNWKIFYKDGSNVKMIYGGYLPNSTNIADIAGLEQRWMSVVVLGDRYNATEFTNKLKDASKWTSLLNENLSSKGCTAQGGVNLETWVKSWNEKGYEKLYIGTHTWEGNECYYIGTTENPTEYRQDLSSSVGYNDSLYFPYHDWDETGDAYVYWLASNYMGVCCSGELYDFIDYNDHGIRPVISLTSSVLTSGKDASGAWVIE